MLYCCFTAALLLIYYTHTTHPPTNPTYQESKLFAFFDAIASFDELHGALYIASALSPQFFFFKKEVGATRGASTDFRTREKLRFFLKKEAPSASSPPCFTALLYCLLLYGAQKETERVFFYV